VEQRIEEVEPGDPHRHRRTEGPRLPRQSAGDRNPGADRCEPVDRAEPKMTEPREPLQIRIDDEAEEWDRPQPPHDRIQLETGDEIETERERAESGHLRTRQ